MKELCLVACSHETMLLLAHTYIYIIHQYILSEFGDNPFCLSFDDPCDKNDNGDYITNNRRIEKYYDGVFFVLLLSQNILIARINTL